ncbi:MAG: hypothetical protein U9O94_07950 [Nanoarchaeota archaeon]|nr:hypothetical protein [Nanoarchaeota archaeon]
MKKDKSKPISYATIRKNRTLGDFVKEEVVDKTKEITKLTWDLVMKWTKKR